MLYMVVYTAVHHVYVHDEPDHHDDDHHVFHWGRGLRRAAGDMGCRRSSVGGIGSRWSSRNQENSVELRRRLEGSVELCRNGGARPFYLPRWGGRTTLDPVHPLTQEARARA